MPCVSRARTLTPGVVSASRMFSVVLRNTGRFAEGGAADRLGEWRPQLVDRFFRRRRAFHDGVECGGGQLERKRRLLGDECEKALPHQSETAISPGRIGRVRGNRPRRARLPT